MYIGQLAAAAENLKEMEDNERKFQDSLRFVLESLEPLEADPPPLKQRFRNLGRVHRVDFGHWLSRTSENLRRYSRNCHNAYGENAYS